MQAQQTDSGRGGPVDQLTGQEASRPQQQRQDRDGLAQTRLVAQQPTPHLRARCRYARPYHPIHHVHPQPARRERGGRRGRRQRSAFLISYLFRLRLSPPPTIVQARGIAVCGGGTLHENGGVDRDELGVGSGISGLLSYSHPSQSLGCGEEAICAGACMCGVVWCVFLSTYQNTKHELDDRVRGVAA